MKKGFHFFALLLLFFFLILMSTSTLSVARNMAANKEIDELANIINGEPWLVEESKYPSELTAPIEEETCEGVEEECLMRRIMSEAHLDYIYTQHHKP